MNIPIETKLKAFKRCLGRCQGCFKELAFPCKFAFRIRPTRKNISLYGEVVLSDHLNLMPVCGNRECEKSVNIEKSPLAIRDLIVSMAKAASSKQRGE